MGAIGIVSNPRSRRNRSHPGTARRLAELLGDEGELVEASTLEELDRGLERLRAARVEVLAVNGGDGTGHVVLTAAARAWAPAPLPKLLLLRGGAMNTVAHGHGIHGGPERILREVLAARRDGVPLRTVERDLLRVEPDGGPARFGFIFGTGVVVTFLERYYRSVRPSPLTAAALLVRGFGSALVGGAFAASLTRRERLRVVSDGEEWPDDSFLAVVAGATPDIGFGFRVFGRCGEQPGFFHAVGVTGTPLQIALALPRIRAGKPWRRRIALDEVARELVVEGVEPRFTVDGDLYQARRTIRVSTGPGVEVILPAPRT